MLVVYGFEFVGLDIIIRKWLWMLNVVPNIFEDEKFLPFLVHFQRYASRVSVNESQNNVR